MWWTVLAVYLIGAAAFCRCFVWYSAKKFPTLNWETTDTVATLGLASLWPVTSFIMGWEIYRLSHPAKPSRGLFAKWHEKDRRS